MKISCFILCLMASVCVAQDGSLDDLISEIFNTDSNSFTSTSETPEPVTIEPVVETKQQIKYESCGIEKECVPRWLCSEDEINTSGINIIDIRIDTSSPCPKYLEVCCALPNKRDKPDVPTGPIDQNRGCGYLNPNGFGFKITGDENQEAQFAEFPWMVAILRQDFQLNLYECGGAVIAPDVILTAAHCVHTKDTTNLIVRAGEWDTQTTKEIIPHEDRYVKEIVYHEKFNNGSLYNDVALLFLDSPLVFQMNIQPVCLPDIGEKFDFERCFATGWGKNKFGKDGEYQVILKKIDLPVMNNPTCQENLRKTRLGRHFILHDSFMCAGGEKDKDTCKGDGGSPLVCPIKGQPDRYKATGLVAWGIGCGEENIPGVYANVAYLRPWIDEKLAMRRINSKYFTA
ncbi:phenoloxidase-activating factor 2 [Drosophila grimshawi]|uniref:Phenoloxidase-activating factor 2 n=1 Tax=Drosophila grimshawi TaxID=7222 RepID=B4JP19_DROGR|nr:phenoloxidase-activating factor 2 [Drosophila grimshawi]XP_032595550.1 phenoloxidase-activating factor 2 [Drosophila grimshawi]XP_032595551.1 phenoloxidase-activating factor 2 [Drosophila grimshawi]EDV99444.1 GH13850 [Drosophila grimshawi]